jgi:alpha-amylase
VNQSIVLYLHVHQPWRVRPYSLFEIGQNHGYFNDTNPHHETNNEAVFRKVAEKSYWPMNQLLQKILDVHPEFRVNLSITGTFLEQCEQWDPELLRSFQKLVATGRVEIIAETYYHSLAFFYSRFEFEKQVLMHREKIQQLFGVKPRVFRNTELAYNNEVAAWAESAGYLGVLAEGWDKVLGWKSPNFVYKAAGTQNLKLLLKNYRLSDDVAFRFSDKQWAEFPLTAEKYMSWLGAVPDDQPLINLFMDYETFGEHQWQDTGIFNFFEAVVDQSIRQGRGFMTATEALTAHDAADTVDMHDTVTWADTERDLSAWLGNSMQNEALRYIYGMEDAVLRTSDTELIADWRNLQTSDHVYYMCTKWFHDGDVHAYFSPYDSPYDAFLYFMNAMRDVRWRVSEYHRGEL